MSTAPSPLRALLVEDRVLPATAFAYVHCDVPASMTLDEWRLARSRARCAAAIELRRERRAVLVANLRRCIGRR